MTQTHSPSIILASYLQAVDECSSPLANPLEDWPVYVGSMPDFPASSCVLQDTGGDTQGRIMGGEAVLFPFVLGRVRCLNYEEGYSKANSIISKFLLIKWTSVSVQIREESSPSLYIVTSVGVLSPIQYIGVDASGSRRNLFQFSLRVKTIPQL